MNDENYISCCCVQYALLYDVKAEDSINELRLGFVETFILPLYAYNNEAFLS